MKIEAGGKYLTRDGRKVTILTTELKSDLYPIVGIVHNSDIEDEDIIMSFTIEGKQYTAFVLNTTNLDLVAEYSEWNDVAVDTPVYVRDNENMEWKKRHFAKYEDEKIFTFISGKTSFTQLYGYLVSWKYARLATEETE